MDMPNVPTPPSPEWWGRVIEYDEGQMYVSDAQIWFQELVNTGNIWRLPTKYLDQAAYFARKGVLTLPKEKKNAVQGM